MRKKRLLALLMCATMILQPMSYTTAAEVEGDLEQNVPNAVAEEEDSAENQVMELDATPKMPSVVKEETEDGEPENLNLSGDEESSSVQEVSYTHSALSDSLNGVTLKVEWNDPVVGEPMTFHVSGSGGSGAYKFRMDAPSYSSPNEYAYESVADPSRGEWTKYTDVCESYDYTFTMTASGTYNYRFYIMDNSSGVYLLRVSMYIQVSDANYPSVNSIVASAVAKCKEETDGSEYEKALWLHDWLLQQLDYDNSLKWSSSESALTRELGTCQAYESAYSKLLTAAGIENAETRDTYDGHTWNAIKLDGEWYQVDCTWDDTKDHWYNFDQTRLYFGLTDELMTLAHKGHAKIYTAENYGTRSTSLKNNYFVRSGDAQSWADTYVTRIQEKLDDGETEFSIAADNASYPPSISGIQNGIIAYALNQMKWSANDEEIDVQVTGGATEFTFVATKNGSITGEKLHSYTLSLDGTIAINLYMELPESLAINQDAYMEFTLPNGSVSQVKVKDAAQKDGYYIFTCRVAAKEMTENVNARMVVDGQSGKEYTVSVQQYAKYILEHSDEYTDVEQKLVKAMLNYGAAAQKLFSYNTDYMANDILTDGEKILGDVNYEPYKYTLTQDSNDTAIRCRTASLLLRSETCIKVYFSLDSEADITDYIIYGVVDGGETELEPQKTMLNGEERYYVEVKNIKARNLDKSVTVKVQKKTEPETDIINLQYSALSYGYAWTNSANPNKQAIATANALYQYCMAAQEYANQVMNQ